MSKRIALFDDAACKAAAIAAEQKYFAALKYDGLGPEDRSDLPRCSICGEHLSPLDGYFCRCAISLYDLLDDEPWEDPYDTADLYDDLAYCDSEDPYDGLEDPYGYGDDYGDG